MITSVKKLNADGVFSNSSRVTFTNGRTPCVPIAEDNTDYQAILKWVAEVDENGESKGNTIEEAD